jgi:hypothetical protein
LARLLTSTLKPKKYQLFERRKENDGENCNSIKDFDKMVKFIFKFVNSKIKIYRPNFGLSTAIWIKASSAVARSDLNVKA